MNERPLYFGDGGNLLGVLTTPTEPIDGAPVVILLNAGLLHRVGPNRLHVNIARRLAKLGHHTLRFDMSGVGDSDLAGEALLYIERSVRDVIEAMDALTSRGVGDRFVLMGLCTGAYNAFRAALADDRVVGAVLLDGYSYPTWRSKLRHYAPRIFQVRRWTGFIQRRLGLGGAAKDIPADLVVFENEHVPRDRFGHELQTLIDRNVDLLMVYTALGPLPYYYEDQLAEAFPAIDLDDNVTVRFYPDADHTFMLPGHRETLLGEIEDWMRTRFVRVREG